MAKGKPAFVEREISETEKPARLSRITLPLDADGRIDWEQVSDKKRVAFVEAVVNDDHTLSALSLKKEAPPGPLTFTPEHIETALDWYATAEQFLLPKIIAARSKNIIRISPEIAAQAFSFTAEQKAQMGPPGAQWANEALPERIKKFLLEIGPGAQFFGMLAFITVSQTKTAVEMWKAQLRGNPATDAPPPSQPVNGKHVDATAPEVVPTAVTEQEE